MTRDTALFIASFVASIVGGTLFTLSFLAGNAVLLVATGVLFGWSVSQVSRILRP